MAHHPGPPPGSGSGSCFGLHFLNSPFGDTTFTKVFVGGLAWETQSETLRRHFEQFGEILEAVVISDKNTGRSKGYGFIGLMRFIVTCKEVSALLDHESVLVVTERNCVQIGISQAHLRPLGPYFGGVPVPRGAYIGSSAYHQAFPYNYQQAISYPPYAYTTYAPEYIYPQNVYNAYTGHQYVQVYGVPGAVDTAVCQYGQLGQPLSGGHGYTAVQGYTVPSHHLSHISGPNVNGETTAPLPAIQAPSPAGKFSEHELYIWFTFAADDCGYPVLQDVRDHGHPEIPQMPLSPSSGWSGKAQEFECSCLAAVVSVNPHALPELVMIGGVWTDGCQNWILATIYREML
ncbi:putative RNA-binding protein 38 [Cocos nucifera]|uniref:Putative RNA-binding protein 38 n=1 Tax=Cocos nucifera TaxID=13894 RepID=A0A8K0HU82_COCNU|nr:putative RNA-binding protein 38 [Cocos nucifera]